MDGAIDSIRFVVGAAPRLSDVASAKSDGRPLNRVRPFTTAHTRRAVTMRGFAAPSPKGCQMDGDIDSSRPARFINAPVDSTSIRPGRPGLKTRAVMLCSFGAVVSPEGARLHSLGF